MGRQLFLSFWLSCPYGGGWSVHLLPFLLTTPFFHARSLPFPHSLPTFLPCSIHYFLSLSFLFAPFFLTLSPPSSALKQIQIWLFCLRSTLITTLPLICCFQSAETILNVTPYESRHSKFFCPEEICMFIFKAWNGFV
jgi:hypothetical protein